MYRERSKPIHVGRELRVALGLVCGLSLLEWERYSASGKLNTLRGGHGLSNLRGGHDLNNSRNRHSLNSLLGRRDRE